MNMEGGENHISPYIFLALWWAKDFRKGFFTLKYM